VSRANTHAVVGEGRPPDAAVALHYAGAVISRALASLWAFAGFAKLWDVIARSIERPATLLFGDQAGAGVAWADTFPGAAVLAVCVCEIIAAWCIVSGRRDRGLVLGLALLAVFFVTIILWPIEAGSTCGCVGTGGDLPGSPVSRLALLGGTHAFALVIARTTNR